MREYATPRGIQRGVARRASLIYASIKRWKQQSGAVLVDCVHVCVYGCWRGEGMRLVDDATDVEGGASDGKDFGGTAVEPWKTGFSSLRLLKATAVI